MQTSIKSVDELSLDPANARRHPERNLEAIMASLRAFGQQKPIVIDRRGIVIAGNGTLEAARRLGWDEIAVVETELDANQATAFGIADNRIAELATWDYEVLQSLMESLDSVGTPIDSLGFNETDLNSIMGVDFDSKDLAGHDDYEANPGRHTIHFEGEAWPRIKAVLDSDDSLPSSEADALVIICEGWQAGRPSNEDAE